MHHKHNNLKTLGPRAANLVTVLYEQNTPIFRLKKVQEVLHVNNTSARNLVRNLVNKGMATRLKPGLFILIPFELGKESEYIGNPFLVARELMNGNDYYLSYASAMEIHGMVTQPQLIIYITTLKKQRPVNVAGIEFRFIPVPKNRFFGFINHWATKQEKAKVSNLERTIIDGLKRPEYCGGLTEVAKGLWIRRNDIDMRQIINYIVRFNMGAVTGRLGYLFELYKIGTSEELELLYPYLTESYASLDPLLKSEGKYLRKWRLQLNVSSEELLSIIRT